MKTKIPLLVLYLFCHSILGSSQIKSDLAQNNIQGKVKSIVEKEYFFTNGRITNISSTKKIWNYNIGGNMILEEYYDDTIKESDTIKYDDLGNKTECDMYSDFFKTMEKLTYTIDRSKNQLQEKYYMEDGNLNKTTLYNYNDKGNLISRIIIDKNEATRAKIEYKYDEKGYKIEEDTYSGNNDLVSRSFSKNDDLGNIIEWNSSLDNEGLKIYKYESYDKFGNWLIKTTFTDNKPERKITREIKYW